MGQDYFVQKKLMFYYADGVRVLLKRPDGKYDLKKYQAIINDQTKLRSLSEESVLPLGNSGYVYHLGKFIGALDDSSVTDGNQTETLNIIDEQGKYVTNTEESVIVNVFEPNLDKYEYAQIPESLYELINARAQADQAYEQQMRQKIMLKGYCQDLLRQIIDARNEMNDKVENSHIRESLINSRIAAIKGDSEEEKLQEEEYCLQHSEVLMQRDALYQKLNSLNSAYRQAEENLNQMEAKQTEAERQKFDLEQTFADYLKLYKQQSFDKLTFADGKQLGFDYDGRMVSMGDGKNQIYFRYEEDLLRDVSDALGKMLIFNYHKNGKLAQFTSRDGVSRNFNYNSAFLVTEILNAHEIILNFENEDNYLKAVANKRIPSAYERRIYLRHDNIDGLVKTKTDLGTEQIIDTYTLKWTMMHSYTGEIYSAGSHGDERFFGYSPYRAWQIKTFYELFERGRLHYRLNKSGADLGLREGEKLILTSSIIQSLSDVKGVVYNYNDDCMTKSWVNGVLTGIF